MFIHIKYNLEQKSIECNSFEEITNYDTVVYIDTTYNLINRFTSLPELPNSLQFINCSYNKLTSLPELPNSLRSLDFSNNQLTSLP